MRAPVSGISMMMMMMMMMMIMKNNYRIFNVLGCVFLGLMILVEVNYLFGHSRNPSDLESWERVTRIRRTVLADGAVYYEVMVGRGVYGVSPTLDGARRLKRSVAETMAKEGRCDGCGGEWK